MTRKEKCYNNQCSKNVHNYCSEDYIVRNGQTWIACYDYKATKEVIEEAIVDDHRKEGVTNPITSLELND